MICYFPYGAIIATLLYGVFVLLILLFLVDVNNGGSVCEGEDTCRSEGVDNSYITWTSDLYLGIWSIFLTLHIVLFVPDKPKRNGHLSLVFMGIGYLVRAIAQRDFYNSGEGDGKGMKAFFIAWPISYFFLTLSIWNFSSYTRRTWQLFNEDKRRKARCCCGLFEVILFESLTIFTFLIILVSCLVCLFDDDIVVQHRIDEYPYDEDTPEPIAVQMVMYSELTWFAWQALFWTAAASLLGTLAMEDVQCVWGLPNSLAAASIIVLQLGTGGLWVIMIVLGIEVDEAVRETFLTASSVLFHYGMIMTTLFAHTLMTTIRYVPPTKATKQARRRLQAKEDDSSESSDEVQPVQVGYHRSMGPPSRIRNSASVSQISSSRKSPSEGPRRIAQDPPTKVTESTNSGGMTVAAMMALRRSMDKSNSSDSPVSSSHQDPPGADESISGTSDLESSSGTTDSSADTVPHCNSLKGGCICIGERDEFVETARNDGATQCSTKNQRDVEKFQEEVIVDDGDDDDASTVLELCTNYDSPIETIGKQFSDWGTSFFQQQSSDDNHQMALNSGSTSTSRVQSDKLKEEINETHVEENIDSGMMSNNIAYLQEFANDFMKRLSVLNDETTERDLEEPEEQEQDRTIVQETPKRDLEDPEEQEQDHAVGHILQSLSDESDGDDMPRAPVRGSTNSDDSNGVTSPPPDQDEYLKERERSAYSSESSDYAIDGSSEKESDDFTSEEEEYQNQDFGLKTTLILPTAMDGSRRDAYMKLDKRRQDAETRSEEFTHSTTAAANKRKMTSGTLQRHSYTFSSCVPQEEDYRDEGAHPYYLQSDGEARWAAS